LLSVKQVKILDTLMSDLKVFESVTKALQSEELDISEARALFDGIIEQCPDMAYYLSSNAKIIHSPNFESGIVKILNKRD